MQHAACYFFRISFYATASTDESVFIIGGLHNGGSITRSSRIAEYKDGSWKNVGNLAQARHNLSAINFGSAIMVVGGDPDSVTSWVHTKFSFEFYLDIFSVNTELWDMESSGSQIIGAPLSSNYHAIGLFEVDVGFCSKNWNCENKTSNVNWITYFQKKNKIEKNHIKL